MHAALDRFEALLAGRPYLYDEFGVADCIAFPFLKYAVFGLPDGDEEPSTGSSSSTSRSAAATRG